MTEDNPHDMVRLSGTLRCSSMHECALVEAYLADHIRLTRAEPGCLSFEVVQAEDPLIWLVEERFVDTASFEAHQQRAKTSEWGLRTQAIVRNYSITRVRRP